VIPNGDTDQKGKPPKSGPYIIRIFHVLKRYENRRRRRSQQEKTDRDLIMARWTRRVGIFTAALALISVVTAAIFWRQLNAMQGQLTEMKTQSLSSERASTLSRAWLFVSYDIPQAPKVENKSISITFSIKNVGQTPAVIVDMETHLFAPIAGAFLSSTPLDPESAASLSLREGSTSAAISKKGEIYDKRLGGRLSIAGGAAVETISQTFFFERDLTPFGHGSWFYCKITYKDIFGILRHTWYYVGLYGAGSEYPNNQEIADKYDRWE
jgi:hypothetical protein